MTAPKAVMHDVVTAAAVGARAALVPGNTGQCSTGQSALMGTHHHAAGGLYATSTRALDPLQHAS